MTLSKVLAFCFASTCGFHAASAATISVSDDTIVLAQLQQAPAETSAEPDNPSDIPEAPPTAVGTDHDLDPAILALVGDPEYGEYLSSECTSCHLTTGDDLGIPDIVGWYAEDFVITMHAYKTNARIHPVMQMMAGRLSNEEIAALAIYFENLGQ